MHKAKRAGNTTTRPFLLCPSQGLAALSYQTHTAHTNATRLFPMLLGLGGQLVNPELNNGGDALLPHVTFSTGKVGNDWSDIVRVWVADWLWVNDVKISFQEHMPVPLFLAGFRTGRLFLLSPVLSIRRNFGILHMRQNGSSASHSWCLVSRQKSRPSIGR